MVTMAYIHYTGFRIRMYIWTYVYIPNKNIQHWCTQGTMQQYDLTGSKIINKPIAMLCMFKYTLK